LNGAANAYRAPEQRASRDIGEEPRNNVTLRRNRCRRKLLGRLKSVSESERGPCLQCHADANRLFRIRRADTIDRLRADINTPEQSGVKQPRARTKQFGRFETPADSQPHRPRHNVGIHASAARYDDVPNRLA
jgi:hypothetical protein